ncbi:MAG: hypothetical protein GXO75_16750 [Calditrichaeota bacterium]|nr:hypothetical protein [Calditrichota bacterium]
MSLNKKTTFYCIVISIILFTIVVAHMSYNGILGGRWIYPRYRSPSAAKKILEKQQPILAWYSIKKKLKKYNIYKHEINEVPNTYGVKSTDSMRKILLKSEISVRLNWAQFLSGAYDSNNENFVVWLDSGIYVLISIKNKKIIAVSFNRKG